MLPESIARALDALRRGNMVVVVDDESREDEGDLFVAAQFTQPQSIAFMLEHTSGLICVATTGEICDRLDLPPMVEHNSAALGTAFTVTVDLRDVTTTGISAYDRSATILALADETTQPDDLLRPGHVHVLRADEGGLRNRHGHTEAAVELATLAGLVPAVTICEIVSKDKLRMARGRELTEFAHEHDLPLLSVREIGELSGGRVADQTAAYVS